MGMVASRVVVLCLMGILGLAACGDCHDNDKAADAFLAAPENRVCTTNADCVVVNTGCAELERSFCGQALLSAEAAKSSRWRELEEQISDCAESNCAICGAALIPTCSDGLCGRT